jgi:hypothetical protein
MNHKELIPLYILGAITAGSNVAYYAISAINQGWIK